MQLKTYNMVVKNPKFRKTLSLDKKSVKQRYELVYKETFETSVPGTAAHVVFQSKNLLKGSKVLDLGCGAGRLSLYAAKYADSVTGIDYIGSAINYANKFAKLCNVKNANFSVTDLDSVAGMQYDVVLISEVLQHVKNPLATLSRCRKLLKKGGYVVVNIPSFDNFRGTVWLTLQNLFNLPMSLTDTVQISSRDLNRMASNAGLKIVKTIGISYDWAWAEWGIGDLKRRIQHATKDARLENISDIRAMHNWLDSKLEFNKSFLNYLVTKRIVKKRPPFSLLKIPRSVDSKIKRYLDDGNTAINPYYCEIEPFNVMGAGAIYFLQKS